MAENKKSFVLYCDLIHTVSKMPSDKAGDLFKHILLYVNDKNPVTDDLIVQLTFEPVKQQLKRDLLKYEGVKEIKSNSGRIGGIKSGEARRKQTEANEAYASNSKQNEANEAVTVNVNDNVTVNDNEIANDIKNKGGSGNFLQIQKWIEELKTTDHIFQQKVVGAGLGITPQILVEALDYYEGLIAQYPAKQNIKDINTMRVAALQAIKEYINKNKNGSTTKTRQQQQRDSSLAALEIINGKKFE